MSLHLLTDGDIAVLKDLIAREKNRSANTVNRPAAYGEDEYHQAPEVYVARTPSGGLPALNEGITGTGTEYEDDVVSSAECDIYQLVEISGVERLRPVEGLSKLVRNLSTTTIAGNQWILIERDKFGYYFFNSGEIIGSSGSGAAKIVRIPQSGLPAARDGATVGLGPGQIVPGVATCEIYQLNGAANPPTFSGTGTYLTVYNLRMVFMPGIVDTLPQYIPVVQEQDGYWLAINWWGVVDVWCDDFGLHVLRSSPGTTMAAPSSESGSGGGFFGGGGSPGPAPPGSGSG